MPLNWTWVRLCDSESVCGGKDPAQRLEAGVLSPERICSPDSKLNQDNREFSTIPKCPIAPHPTPQRGKAPPHLRMDIEVFVGFKALSLTLGVVKQKAFFDDEKPGGGGERMEDL